ncbi:hypothetical protein DC429_12485 [Arthrobacter sp. TPD3018]|uniref:PhoD-like phosphatase N-terminal domain-containing protein n=1 Tax=Bacteria TaxID=2 RepID=UPI000D513203|nr:MULTISPECIES: PhoD-like phosphatase N-terminal domain-containing protein [Bacteria]PVE53427.1 hypothetical protein DC425_13505 [Sphingomonas sp. TPD3009]PVE56135.1 hypothetical protein DC429_12485 [Arthrobacter sp. TPD3018]PVE81734.1 hypothetical protein DC431_13860 [Sphingomonas melonis]
MVLCYGTDEQPLVAAAVPVRCAIVMDEGLRRIVHAGRGLAHPKRAHAVHVESAGPPDDRRSFYRVDALGRTPGTPAYRAVDRAAVSEAGAFTT